MSHPYSNLSYQPLHPYLKTTYQATEQQQQQQQRQHQSQQHQLQPQQIQPQSQPQRHPHPLTNPQYPGPSISSLPSFSNSPSLHSIGGLSSLTRTTISTSHISSLSQSHLQNPNLLHHSALSASHATHSPYSSNSLASPLSQLTSILQSYPIPSSQSHSLAHTPKFSSSVTPLHHQLVQPLQSLSSTSKHPAAQKVSPPRKKSPVKQRRKSPKTAVSSSESSSSQSDSSSSTSSTDQSDSDDSSSGHLEPIKQRNNKKRNTEHRQPKKPKTISKQPQDSYDVMHSLCAKHFFDDDIIYSIMKRALPTDFTVSRESSLLVQQLLLQWMCVLTENAADRHIDSGWQNKFRKQASKYNEEIADEERVFLETTPADGDGGGHVVTAEGMLDSLIELGYEDYALISARHLQLYRESFKSSYRPPAPSAVVDTTNSKALVPFPSSLLSSELLLGMETPTSMDRFFPTLHRMDLTMGYFEEKVHGKSFKAKRKSGELEYLNEGNPPSKRRSGPRVRRKQDDSAATATNKFSKRSKKLEKAHERGDYLMKESK